MIGTVVSFDAAQGLGEIVDRSGCCWPFHCVEIVDGTRTAVVGATVSFELAPKLGRFEAVSIDPTLRPLA